MKQEYIKAILRLAAYLILVLFLWWVWRTGVEERQRGLCEFLGEHTMHKTEMRRGECWLEVPMGSGQYRRVP